MNISSKLFMATALVATTLAASAAVDVQDVLLRKKGPDINVRVIVDNPSASTQKGPVLVTLFVRPDSNASWSKIKVWSISKIKPGEKISRDIFSENSAILRNAANNYTWQARATVSAPGAKGDEMSVTNSGDSNTGK